MHHHGDALDTLNLLFFLWLFIYTGGARPVEPLPQLQERQAPQQQAPEPARDTYDAVIRDCDVSTWQRRSF